MRHGFIGFPAIAAMLSACATTPDPTPAAADRGARIYDTYCVVCHGADGRGGGPLAADLSVAPADLTTLSARNAGVFPREAAMAQIYGYPGRYQQAAMPEFGPLLEGPRVSFPTADGRDLPSPQALLDIVAYLETIQQ